MKLRLDDLLLLETIRDTLDLGRLSIQSQTGSTNRKPQVRWTVHRKSECVELVRFFETYPLRSKKANDFEVWRQAVAYWNQMPRAGGDWEPMAIYQEWLREARKYPEALSAKPFDRAKNG